VAVFAGFQNTAADQAEIRHEFFALSGVGAASVLATAKLPGDGSGEPFGGSALAEAIQADAKNRSEDATARHGMILIHQAEPDTFAVAAGAAGESDRIGAIPQH